MATATGNGGVVKLVADGGTLAAVAEVRSFSIEETADTIESTAMGATDGVRSYLAGNKTGTVSIECYWDAEEATHLDLDAAKLMDFEILPNGVGTGKKYSGEGIVTSKSISASFDGMIEASFSLQTTGAITESDA